MIYRFLLLREESRVDVRCLRRVSLEQCREIVTRTLRQPSGGRFPLYLVLAAFTTIKKVFALSWLISDQPINAADSASGAGGDITISQGSQINFVVEVTERQVTRERVISTFDTKIAPNAIEDYLFLTTEGKEESDALQQAHRYFSQGHEVNFLKIADWIVAILAVLGKDGRDCFMKTMCELLQREETPKGLKVAWNRFLTEIASQ
jgi:hypothetical protein